MWSSNWFRELEKLFFTIRIRIARSILRYRRYVEKLVRNLLGDVDVYLDNNAIPATWNDIRHVCAFQEEIGIKIANKLTDTHVNFKNNKMKVRLATQALSDFTADGLAYMRTVLKHPKVCTCKSNYSAVINLFTVSKLSYQRAILSADEKTVWSVEFRHQERIGLQSYMDNSKLWRQEMQNALILFLAEITEN